MNVAADRVRVTYSNDSFKKGHLRFKKIGTSANLRKLPRMKVIEDINNEAREKRKKELMILEKEAIMSRRREEMRRLTRRQLDLLSEIPLISLESLETTKSSPSSSISPEPRSVSKFSTAYYKPSFVSTGEGAFHLSENEEDLTLTESERESEFTIRLRNVKLSHPTQKLSVISAQEDEEETWKEYSTYHETKQYRALMQEVCKRKTYDHNSPKNRERKRSDENTDLMDKTFKRLKEDLKGTIIPWPEDEFFEKNYKHATDVPFWMVQDIREMVSIPDDFALSEDCHLSRRAATVRMAAWDYIFFKNQKVGERNVAGLFCKLTEGETPVHKFLFPSNEIVNLSQLECLWKPLMGSEVLKEYCSWLYEKKSDMLPKYLKKNGYLKDLINERCKQKFSYDERQSAQLCDNFKS